MCCHHAHMQPACTLIDFIEAGFFGFLSLEHFNHVLPDNGLFCHVGNITHGILDPAADLTEFAADNRHNQCNHRHQH